MTTLPEEAVKAMPERIYAKVHGASTDVISGQRGLIGGWNEHHRDGQAEYVRADLCHLPAPAATDTGLETFSVEKTSSGHPYMKSDPDGDYVTRSQAEELLAAERAARDEIILRQARAIEKLESDNAALIHDLNRIKDHETELVNDNSAQAARIKGFEGFLDDLAEILGCERDIGDVVNELDAINNRAEALEAKLAAAQEAHKSLFGDKTMEDILWPDVKPTDLITIRVQKQIYDKARAVLGGKPS